MAKTLSKSIRLVLLHLTISLSVTLLVIILTQNILFDIPFLRNIELSLIDLRFHERTKLTGSKSTTDVVIVSISQESFRNLPDKWPWPIHYYTQLLRNLHRAGASVIGIDLTFPPIMQTNNLEENEFRRTVKEFGNIVFAGKVRSEQTNYILHEDIPHYGNRFIDTESYFGIVNLPADNDEVRRRYMPFVYDMDEGKRLPTFSMAVLNAYFHKQPRYTVEIKENNFEYLTQSIPRYDAISFLINYYGTSGTFQRVEFSDVLDSKDFKTVDELKNSGSETNTFDDPDYGLLNDSIFAGKIVLIGSWEPEDKDLFLTPMSEKEQQSSMMYGVEIHANVIQSILDNNFITRQPFWMTIFIVFGLSLFTFVFTEGLKSIRTKYSAIIEILGIVIIMAELFIIYWASTRLFVKENFLTDMTSPSLAVILCYVGSTVYSYVAERRQKILIKSMFSRYVNPTVVNELVAHPEKLRLGGERKELTIFFSDIENFTQISEKMAPENLVTVLNEYLDVMTAIIIKNNGTLDKYEGDAIVAFWGAPISQPDHAYLACRTAVEMQKELIRLRQKWLNEHKPQLKIRIGISTGEVIVGNMGGISRFDYTVIGDSVNLGARLETANKQYKTSIMISEITYKYVKEKVIARELDLLVVAGKTEPIRVYELIGLSDEDVSVEKKKFLNYYNHALELYRERQWDEAIKNFESALAIFPEDFPSQIYMERSHLYKKSPPPENWNGVFFLLTK